MKISTKFVDIFVRKQGISKKAADFVFYMGDTLLIKLLGDLMHWRIFNKAGYEMEIITTNFEKPYILNIEGKTVVLTFFKTEEHGNVKIGVDAPRGLAINREEIFLQKKEKHQL